MRDYILQNKKVLVVDDNIINQTVVKHALIKLGAMTEIAGDGEEAITLFRNNIYDLVLMDVQMPIMDGYDATRYIRNQLQSKVPIIAMTAFALKGEDEKCLESGMNGYVSKPFTLESLYNAINQVFDTNVIVQSNPYILTDNNTSVDVSMLYEIVGNDEEYIKAMITTFIENIPTIVQKIEAALANKDWDNVAKSAHYAKSSLSVVKIAEILDWIIMIEYSARKKSDLEAIPALIAKVKEKFVIVGNILMERFSFKPKS